eukprot:GDKI01044780.1.p1 GENE.GDKI01044780.1~~GDKI01044780.1.p1  ORF type:complete len:418 (+),score=118.61 GDKI01044780.1:163-1416(+)
MSSMYSSNLSPVPRVMPEVLANLNPDERAQLNVARRRSVEESRKPRIFDPKIRTIGVDKQALDQQVAEKQQKEQLEKEIDAMYAKQGLMFDTIQKMQSVEQARAAREAEEATKAFSLMNLKKENRREFDLNDPKALKSGSDVTLPADQLGPASMQTLNGANTDAKARLRAQQRQMREWIAQQKFEKEMLKKAEQEEERMYATQALQGTSLLTGVELHTIADRRAMAVAAAKANRELAMQKAKQTIETRIKEQEINAAEVRYHLTSPFLADGRLDLTQKAEGSLNGTGSSLGEGSPTSSGGDQATHGTLREGFKGMTREQRQTFLSDNFGMWRDKLEQKHSAVGEEKAWADQMEAQRRLAVACDRERNRHARRMREETVNKNLTLAKEQKERKDILDKVVYTNKPTEAFFSSFGTSTR